MFNFAWEKQAILCVVVTKFCKALLSYFSKGFWE